ncbi:MAG TPA: SH3 domain-containing protein [Rhizomicrobium sp.]|nr:SH3 domain-containing protein [Rhizomicrobium sp.]
MAPRSSTGFAKKPPAPVEPARVEQPARALPEEPELPDPIPIDLAPLVAPYRRQGRISLRVERLPHRARLSHGQINGDRSFSLALDELEGLQYLPPPGGGDPPTLGIRVIRVGAGDASTLALLDYPVSPETTGAGAAALNDSKEQRRLRDEIVKLKALLQARDNELADVQATVDKVKGSGPLPEPAPAPSEIDVAALRAAWDAEAEQRIAEAIRETAARFEKQRDLAASGEAERQTASETLIRTRVAEERERVQKDADAALKRAEKDWKAMEAARAAAADSAWQKRLDKALADSQAQAQSRAANDSELRALRDDLANAKKSLEENEAELARERGSKIQTRDGAVKQLSADNDRLRTELAKTKAALGQREQQLAQERDTARLSRTDTERERNAEQDRLRDQLAKLKAALAERDADLARERDNVRRAEDETEKLRASDQERQHLPDELAKLQRTLGERDKLIARQQVELDAGARSAEAKLTRLSEEFAKARAALSARESELKHVRSGEQQVRAEAETLRSDSAELKRITTELVQVKASLAVREAELAGARGANDEERERWRRDAESSLTDAKRNFKESEAERLVAAEAEWRRQSDLAIADVVARLHEAEAKLREGSDQGEKVGAELARLREERAKLKSQMAERDNELLQAKLSQEQARERWKREADEALDKAQRAWKADETARIAASEAMAKDQNTIALNETTARLKHTEALLAEAKAHVETLRRRGDAEDVARLRKDFAAVQAELARREQEVMDLRSDHEIERVRLANEARSRVQQADHQWHEEDTEEVEAAQRAQNLRGLIRIVVFAAGFAALAAVGYYKIAPLVTEQAADMLDLDQGAPPSPSAAATAPASQATAVVTKSVNLRGGPSTSAAVIGSLARDSQVIVHERQGNWVHVETQAKGTDKALQGWVFNTFVRDNPPAVKSPSSPAQK